MDGDGTLFLGSHHLGLLFESADDAVYGVEEVLLAYRALIVASCDEGSLVTHVGDVGARESRRLSGQVVDVERVVGLQRFQVHLEDGLSLGQVGQVHVDLPVETSGAQQCLVEHVDTVGGCKHDDTRVGAESVHFGEQCVERVLAFVVATHRGVLGACASHGVDLVDEDDARSLLLGLCEYVSDARCAHTDKHLNEVGTRHGEEGHARFARHGFRKQGLTGSRRANEQCSLGNLSAQFGVFLWVLEEVDDLLHLLFGTLLACYVLKGYAHLASLVVELGLAFPHVEDAAASASATHAACHVPEEEYQWQEPQHIDQEVEHVAALLVLIAEALQLSAFLLRVEVSLKLVDRAKLHLDKGA